MATRETDSFQAAVDRRLSTVPPKTTGYVTLGCIAIGMILFGTFGPNDIWTSLIVGAVLGGIAGGFLIRMLLMGIEAMATRRLELAIVVGGVALMLAIWYMAP